MLLMTVSIICTGNKQAHIHGKWSNPSTTVKTRIKEMPEDSLASCLSLTLSLPSQQKQQKINYSGVNGDPYGMVI